LFEQVLRLRPSIRRRTGTSEVQEENQKTNGYALLSSIRSGKPCASCLSVGLKYTHRLLRSDCSKWGSTFFATSTLNTLLERLEIPKIEPQLLAKIVVKDRTIDQARRSKKGAASLGLHSFRPTNATAMDSPSIPQQIRKRRLGHSGSSVTENYTHTSTKDERDAAENLREFFGTGWPEPDGLRLTREK
jgi:hypothetical protein